MLIRLIGVKFSGLVSGAHQINAFEDSEEMINLYKSLDDIRKKYGKKAIRRAVGLY
jgi:DNA polymerase-4